MIRSTIRRRIASRRLYIQSDGCDLGAIGRRNDGVRGRASCGTCALAPVGGGGGGWPGGTVAPHGEGGEVQAHGLDAGVANLFGVDDGWAAVVDGVGELGVGDGGDGGYGGREGVWWDRGVGGDVMG